MVETERYESVEVEALEKGEAWVCPYGKNGKWAEVDGRDR